jgi:nitrite reductase/ring-hydroxylating ferredoxin subunit/multimeric flavodoxin WrbA
MSSDHDWIDLGDVADLSAKPLSLVEANGSKICVSFDAGVFGAVSAVCIHRGGPLDEGRLIDGCIECPWHHWRYDRITGAAQGKPGGVAKYDVQVREDRVYAAPAGSSATAHSAPAPLAVRHPLERPIVRQPGPLRVVGISTTNMNLEAPRSSTSEQLLNIALGHASEALGAETKLIKLRELRFRTCEGYYSKSAQACTWPCTITQGDSSDEMQQVYEALVFWADVVLVATPIRWGSASSLYFKMAERMNCIQNQITISDRVLIRNKVASFIITGGQDNIQAVAGQMLMFFAEVGFHFPQFPFIAHSRGWSAEDMERNVEYVEKSEDLRDGARQLVARAVAAAALLNGHGEGDAQTSRGGRKASPLHL